LIAPAPDPAPEVAPPGTRPIEVELKYRMTGVATGSRLLAADDLAGFTALGSVDTVRHEDRYLDTADHALSRGGLRGSDPSRGRRACHHAQRASSPG